MIIITAVTHREIVKVDLGVTRPRASISGNTVTSAYAQKVTPSKREKTPTKSQTKKQIIPLEADEVINPKITLQKSKLKEVLTTGERMKLYK